MPERSHCATQAQPYPNRSPSLSCLAQTLILLDLLQYSLMDLLSYSTITTSMLVLLGLQSSSITSRLDLVTNFILSKLGLV